MDKYDWLDEILPQKENAYEEGIVWLQRRCFSLFRLEDGVSMDYMGKDMRIHADYSLKAGDKGWSMLLFVHENGDEKTTHFISKTRVHASEALLDLRKEIGKALNCEDDSLDGEAWLAKAFPTNEDWVVDGERFLYSQGFVRNSVDFTYNVHTQKRAYLMIHAFCETQSNRTDDTGWYLQAFYDTDEGCNMLPLKSVETKKKYHDIRKAFEEIKWFLKQGFDAIKRNDAFASVKKVQSKDWIDKLIPKGIWHFDTSKSKCGMCGEVAVTAKDWYLQGRDWLLSHGFMLAMEENGKNKFVYMPNLRSDHEKEFRIIVTAIRSCDYYEYMYGKRVGWIGWCIWGNKFAEPNKHGEMDVRDMLTELQPSIEEHMRRYNDLYKNGDTPDIVEREEEPKKEMTVEEKNELVGDILKGVLAKADERKKENKHLGL